MLTILLQATPGGGGYFNRERMAQLGPLIARADTTLASIERVAQEGIRRVLLDFSAAWHRLPTDETMAAFEARLVADEEQRERARIEPRECTDGRHRRRCRQDRQHGTGQVRAVHGLGQCDDL